MRCLYGLRPFSSRTARLIVTKVTIFLRVRPVLARIASATTVGRLLTASICCAAVGLLIQNIILQREIRNLRSQPTFPALSTGQRIGSLAGLALDGTPRKIALSGQKCKLMVIAYSPSCLFCRNNHRGWVNTAGQARQNGWRVVWLSRDPVEVTQEYCNQQGIPAEDAIAEPTVRTYLKFGLVSVPTTIAIGADGVVEKVWSGELHADGWRELSAYFGMARSTRQSHVLFPGALLIAAFRLDIRSGY